MRTIVAFVILQFLASGYACWRGGAPEKWVAVLLMIACVASILTPLQTAYTYLGVNIPVLRVDLALLVGLIAIALMADRFWPMWLAALQLVAIAAHGVRVYDPLIVPSAYWWLTTKIAYPMLLVLVIGVHRHRQRLLAGLPEYSWTLSRYRHAGRRGDTA